MRLAVLASSAFALCLTPLHAQSSGADLREEIRRIVREEVRAALKDAMKEMHSTRGVEFFTRDEHGLPGKAVRVVPVEKIEVAPAERIRVVTPEKVKASADGVDDGTPKTIAVTPDQLKHGFQIHTGKGTPAEHNVDVQIVGIEGLKEDVKKAVGECCEALEKCCEAVEECKVKTVEVSDLKLEPEIANPDVVGIDDITTAKQAEKAAKKAKKAEKKAKKPHGDV